MRVQSTNHLFMIEPAEFFANPETAESNVYQMEKNDRSPDDLLNDALKEFRAFRDKLVEHGVTVTTALGRIGSPDMVFPNWMSTHQEGRAIIYPMLSPNRRAEREPHLLEMLSQPYREIIDWSTMENEGLILESTASIVSDHVNKRAYSGLSARTSRPMVEKWAETMGYDVMIFETKSHTGKPVYHTDYLMFIGTSLAAICTECLLPEYRDATLNRLKETHTVIELSMDQLMHSSGNALEVVGTGGKRYLAISESGYAAMTGPQKDLISQHFDGVITTPLPTLEKYGGGSARCMLMEMF
ncbi:MAG: arginine deiminase-related protein [Alphaproteobacteria bacterium]|nr:arginine deiminase-related protein [Alphaproteobacteria bacterium]